MRLDHLLSKEKEKKVFEGYFTITVKYHEKRRKRNLSSPTRRFIVYFSMCFLFIKYIFIVSGDIAQLARAPALQAGGQGFDSLYLHQSLVLLR